MLNTMNGFMDPSDLNSTTENFVKNKHGIHIKKVKKDPLHIEAYDMISDSSFVHAPQFDHNLGNIQKPQRNAKTQLKEYEKTNIQTSQQDST
jgi:hypothetical protein